jgi:hypothetical protein
MYLFFVVKQCMFLCGSHALNWLHDGWWLVASAAGTWQQAGWMQSVAAGLAITGQPNHKLRTQQAEAQL